MQNSIGAPPCVGQVVRSYRYSAYREPSGDSRVLIASGQVIQVVWQVKWYGKTSGMASQVVWQDKWYGKSSGMTSQVVWQVKWYGKSSGMASQVV
jgi:hypothetical protein